jgi:hypothetical protein
MTAHDVLKRALAAGVTLIADGSLLRLQADKEPPSELIEELRAHKPALMQLLMQPGAAAADPASRISSWLAATDRLPKACGPHGQRLKVITEDFALGPWAACAVQNGWTDADLFALDGGLIPEMAYRALHLRAISKDTISLINGRGAFEEWPRPNAENTIPWWEDQRCVARFH